MNERLGTRSGRVLRSDRKSLAQRRPAAVDGCHGSARRTPLLRLLRGEDLETVSRGLGVTAATLTQWRDAFLAAGELARGHASLSEVGWQVEGRPACRAAPRMAKNSRANA